MNSYDMAEIYKILGVMKSMGIDKSMERIYQTEVRFIPNEHMKMLIKEAEIPITGNPKLKSDILSSFNLCDGKCGRGCLSTEIMIGLIVADIDHQDSNLSCADHFYNYINSRILYEYGEDAAKDEEVKSIVNCDEDINITRLYESIYNSIKGDKSDE